MKRTLLFLTAVYLLTAASWALVQGATLGRDVAITGRITCAFCGLTGHPDCTKESCRLVVNSGAPVLLTDAKGNRYMLLSGKKEKTLMTEERKGLLQEKITVHGKLVKRGGVQGIYVRSMEKAT